jgi:NAD(P)H-nitrite reductase large subunit
VPDYTSGLFDSNIACSGIVPKDHPEAESITWVDWQNLNYRRLFFKDGRLVGAVLIGEMRGHKRLLELIRTKVRLESCERERLSEAASAT